MIREVVLRYNGYVERFAGDVAIVRLTDDTEELIGEIPVADLSAKGCREREKFVLKVILVAGEYEIELEPAADGKISPERWAEIEKMVDDSLGE